MKRLLALILALVMSLALVACGGEKEAETSKPDDTSKPATSEPAPEKEEEKVLKIGVVEPQTGGSSFEGANQIAGIEAALKDWEEHYGNPGGYKIELVIGDSQSSPDVGVTEAERLINSENVSALIGTYNSGVGASVAPVAVKYKTPFMVVNAVSDVIGYDNSNYVFRANNCDTISAKNMQEYFTWLHKEFAGDDCKIAYIYGSDDWGTGEYNTRVAAWKDSPWEIVYAECVNPGITDFSTIITKMKNSGANFLHTSLGFNECVLLMRQMKEQGFVIPVQGGGGFASPDFLPAIGADGEYVITVAGFIYDPTILGEEVAKIQEEFLATHKEAVGLGDAFANGWMGMYTLLHAIDDAQSDDRQAIADALDTMELWNENGERTFLLYPKMKGIVFEDIMNGAGDAMIYNQNPYPVISYCQVQNGQMITIYPEGDQPTLITDIPAWNER